MHSLGLSSNTRQGWAGAVGGTQRLEISLTQVGRATRGKRRGRDLHNTPPHRVGHDHGGRDRGTLPPRLSLCHLGQRLALARTQRRGPQRQQGRHLLAEGGAANKALGTHSRRLIHDRWD